MLRIGLFSDIHANLPALEAVFEDMENRHLDMLFCLGDLVGYATWPNEVVEAIRHRNIATLAGNYDFGVGHNSDDCGCAYKTDEDRARGVESIQFTNAIITQENRRYLRSLPKHIQFVLGDQESIRLLMLHGSPRRVNEYLFEDRPDASFLRIMRQAQADIMFFGHTHKPFHKIIYDDNKYLHAINIGSVGKPKDGDPRACYAVVDMSDDLSTQNPDAIRVEFVRVLYDVERAARAIETSMLPDAFARMLQDA